MEIEEKIYQQYRDTPYKLQETSKNQQNSEQNEENKNNPKKHNAYNQFLKNIKESIREPQGRRISDNITLRVSIDKTSQNNPQKSSLLNINNNSLEKDNKGQHKYSLDNKDKRKNIAFINNIYKEEIEYENNNPNNFDKNQIMNNNNENKVFWNNNNFGGSNNNKNNNNYIEYEKNNEFNYNPFIKKTELGNGQNSQINDLNNQNYTNYEHKELKTIEQKLREEPNNNNFNNNQINEGNEISKNGGKNNILITTDLDSLDEEIKNYNFVLSCIQVKGKKTDNKDIAKLKKDLNVIEGKKKELNEDNLNKNQENQNFQNNAQFIESQNIYGNQDKNDDDDKNKKFFYLKAEPIENNIQNNNYPDEENNLATSSEIVDFDKNSEYTIKTGTNIDRIVRKSSKLCPILLAILLGSAGLLFLLYTSKTIRNILLNLLKAIPGFFSALFGSFGKEIEDFLEKYNDSYRFLGDLVMIIIFWIIFRFLFKCIWKYIKKEHN